VGAGPRAHQLQPLSALMNPAMAALSQNSVVQCVGCVQSDGNTHDRKKPLYGFDDLPWCLQCHGARVLVSGGSSRRGSRTLSAVEHISQREAGRPWTSGAYGPAYVPAVRVGLAPSWWSWCPSRSPAGATRRTGAPVGNGHSDSRRTRVVRRMAHKLGLSPIASANSHSPRLPVT
jgi:hypothetical protein